MNGQIKTIEGECLCGSVRYQIQTPARFVANCHCSICRKAHGAAFVAWAGIKNEQFSIVDGRAFLSQYQSTQEATRSFCKRCGSPLLFQSTRWPGEIHIALAHLKGPHDLKPMANVFYSDRAPWCENHDGLPQFGGQSGTEPLKR